jgi:hypothetical protein
MPRGHLFQYRRGLKSQWASTNPTLEDGEPGLETDTHRVKFGDSSTAWNDLPYIETEKATTIGSSATPTPTGDATRNLFSVTSLGVGAVFAVPSGTPESGNRLLIRIKDDGTARSLGWNAIYRAIGVTLPTTTILNKTLYIGCIYNAADSKWDVLAIGQQA